MPNFVEGPHERDLPLFLEGKPDPLIGGGPQAETDDDAVPQLGAM